MEWKWLKITFKEGDLTGEDCPKCGKPLYYEMGFQDCFSYKTGHYTIDDPLIICNECDYVIGYEKQEVEYD